MKPDVRKLKNARGRITGYEASFGPVRAEGATPEQARDLCAVAVHAALERLERGANVSRWRDHVWAVYPTEQGWHYWIETGCDGRGHPARQGATREDAEHQALHHLAQNLWGEASDDATYTQGLPPAVASEIESWIAFQRLYVRHRSNGKSDVEAHRLACERVPA
jgi:hypothetical protein